jgi:oligoendopeptidase F
MTEAAEGVGESRISGSSELHQWDLSDLYPGTDSAELKADLEDARAAAAGFEKSYRGRLEGLDGAGLGEAIAAYERIEETLARIMSYAQLVFSGHMDDPAIARFYQTTQERVTDISTHVLFFALELNRLDDERLEEVMAAGEAARYRPWVRDVRVFRPHQLSDELEKLLHEKHVAGRAAWVRLFDETLAGLRFPVDGKELTETEVLHLLVDKDATTRRKAAEALGRVLGANIRIFAMITNTLAKDKEIEDRWRNYPTPESARNLSNHVEDEVVGALASAVRDAYPELSHRYYAIKARWFGVEQLEYWDRNAPLPEAEDRVIPWAEAKATVLDAYAGFSDSMAELGERFFDRPWIDARPRPGKASGAFSHPTVPSAHPYMPQGHLMADTPLTLAETASVFGEMLTFRALLEKETEPGRRRVMLATKVEDMLNTVVRQIAMFEFERRVHRERREGELTAERLGEVWLETQHESLGHAVRLGGEYGRFWAYIPHFIHAPFYVYAYAFGDCLVNSLYAVYQSASRGFAEKYLDMLRAGGTLRHQELLAPFGLDASDPAFWKKGLGVISGFIEELEQLP